MSGYISIPGIKGAVSASGYEGWIEIDSFKVAAGRELPLVTHTLQGRGQCTARASEFMIGKLMDSSTPLLFQQVCIGRAIPHVQLDLCQQTPQGLQAYVQYNLDNIIFSQYSITAIRDQNQVQSREWLALNFTGLELRYTPDSGSPVTTRSEIASRQPDFSHLTPAVWVYQQSTGRLTKNGKYFATGYAGCGEDARNNSAYQYEHGVEIHLPNHDHICKLGAGPLPIGRYTIGKLQQKNPTVGLLAMPLIPLKENIMLGRDGFYIHGPNKKHIQYSSDGCIILTKHYRIKMAAYVKDGENTLQVIP